MRTTLLKVILVVYVWHFLHNPPFGRCCVSQLNPYTLHHLPKTFSCILKFKLVGHHKNTNMICVELVFVENQFQLALVILIINMISMTYVINIISQTSWKLQHQLITKFVDHSTRKIAFNNLSQYWNYCTSDRIWQHIAD
jgi:hypothetical protein